MTNVAHLPVKNAQSPHQQIDRVLESNLPPCNVELEETILGGLILDPGAIARVAELIRPGAFYIAANQAVYDACLGLYRSDRAIDLMAIYQELVDRGQLDKVGGQQRLAQLIEETINAVNIDQHAELLNRLHQQRQLINFGAEVAMLGWQPDPVETIAAAERKLLAIASGGSAAPTVQPMSERMISAYDRLEARKAGKIAPGIPTGFYDLDAMTQGLQRSDLIIIAARPSMGKTAIALNIARAVGISLPVLVFSLEMSTEQLDDRLLAAESGTELSAIRTGKIAKNQWESIGHAIARLSDIQIETIDDSDITVQQMRSHARRFAALNGGQIGAIVIDYLQLMGDGDAGANRVQELSVITRQLKKLARELDVPVIALSQLSRGVEQRTNKRPMMSDLRESGSIEQDADLIIMLYRDEYYNPDTSERGIAEVIITKHRNGPVGTVKLLFEPQFTRFRNLAATGGRA
ncbi:MAG TPA: replicative DNA helicase [Chroococcidiopsis sp.]